MSTIPGVTDVTQLTVNDDTPVHVLVRSVQGVPTVVFVPLEDFPSGWVFLGKGTISITAPVHDATDPLRLDFLTLHPSKLVPGVPATAKVDVFRTGGDGVPRLVEDCAVEDVLGPDPCVSHRQLLTDGSVTLTVLTTQASTWNLAVQAQAAATPPPGPAPAPSTPGTTAAPRGLPRTGADILGMAALGLWLTAAGGAMTRGTRRRRMRP